MPIQPWDPRPDSRSLVNGGRTWTLGGYGHVNSPHSPHCHMGYSFRLAARVLLYASSHRQDNTYHDLYYTSSGELGKWEIDQWVHHEGSIQRPIVPWVKALTTELHLAPPPYIAIQPSHTPVLTEMSSRTSLSNLTRPISSVLAPADQVRAKKNIHCAKKRKIINDQTINF